MAIHWWERFTRNVEVRNSSRSALKNSKGVSKDSAPDPVQLLTRVNHQLCNPLGVIRGQCEMFLLNEKGGIYKDKSRDELLKVAMDIMAKVIDETDRAAGVTRAKLEELKREKGIFRND